MAVHTVLLTLAYVVGNTYDRTVYILEWDTSMDDVYVVFGSTYEPLGPCMRSIFSPRKF